MIPFKNIPNNWRLPLFYAELDNSQANTQQYNQRTLLVGQITSAGNATPNVPVLCISESDAIAKCGAGSMLARMYAKYRANDPVGEVWILPLADNGSAVAALGSIKFNSVATAAGVISLYVGGRLVSVPVTTAQTTANLATALAAAINLVPGMAVTAAVDGSDVTKVDLTAKNAGPIGNDTDIRFNYYGAQNGEATPAGITYTVVAMATGATPPVFTTAFANLVDMPFDFIVFPYTDATSLNAAGSLLNDTTGRWSFDKQIYGQAFAVSRGTVGTLTTLGLTRNDQHVSILGVYDTPSMVDEWAAAYVGALVPAIKDDPGRPVQTLVVNDVLPPPLSSRFVDTDRNTLLYSGISTYTVSQAGIIALENIITTYQLNAFNQPDNSYLEIETMFSLMWNLRDLAIFVTSTYPRMKLVADNTRLAAGSAAVTPGMVRSALIARYEQNEFNGYCQNSAAFAQNLIVQQNASNPNRLDVLWPGTLVDQLRMFALLAQFRLE